MNNPAGLKVRRSRDKDASGFGSVPVNAELNNIMSMIGSNGNGAGLSVGGGGNVSQNKTTSSVMPSPSPSPITYQGQERNSSAPQSSTPNEDFAFDDEVFSNVEGGTVLQMRDPNTMQTSLSSSVESSDSQHPTHDNYLYNLEYNPSSKQEKDLIDRLKFQIVNLQETLHNERSNKTKNLSTTKLVSGAQFRIGRAAPKCENCGVFSDNLKKSRESIRSLKFQLSQMEDKYSGLRKSKGAQEEAVAATVDYDSVLKKMHELEVEIGRLRKNAQADKMTIDGLQKMILEMQVKDESRSEEIKRLGDSLEHSKVQREAARDTVEKLRGELSQYKIQLEAAELKLADALQARQSGDDSLRDQLRDKNQRIEELERELQRALEDKQDMQRQLEDKEKERVSSEERLKDVQAECSKLKEISNQLQDDLEDSHQKLTRCDDERFQAVQSLHDSKGRIVDLSNENAELMKQLQELRDALASKEGKEADMHQALEKAISKSVRLCVVAPTVNVHVSGKNIKTKGGLEQEKLQEFLHEQVLQKYSFLFEQRGEDLAPDGSSLQQWLQSLLNEMQVTIEKHVNNALNQQDKA